MTEKTVLIDNIEGVGDLVDCVVREQARIKDQHPQLYIDLEGEELSRNGTLFLLTLLISIKDGPYRHYIVDIHTLGGAAFSAVGKLGKSLKNILESPQILKVFFDVRNDSDALYSHYGIKLQGVRDIQLMESASRPGRRAFVSGLSKCIENLPPGLSRDQCVLGKSKGEALWNPDKGGSFKVFTDRPLSKEIIQYCVGDVLCLPALYDKYRLGVTGEDEFIAKESQKRVSQSQMSDYQPRSREKARSPWTPEQNRMLDSWIARSTTKRDVYVRVEDIFDSLSI